MEEEKEIDSKEVSDALHMLLHCSLKDTEYETQKEQFEIVNAYIKQLEEENNRIIIEKAEALQKVRKYKAKIKDSIPKSKVKEKIEKYRKKIDVAQGEELLIFDSKIDVLQELLEEE